jgi:hypothetical protein
VAGGDQVQELHRPVDVADRRRDRAGVLEVLAGLPAPLDLGVIDLVAGGVVAHRLERDLGPTQQTGGHLGGDVLVPGELLHHPDLVLVGDLGCHRRTLEEVAGHRRGDVLVPSQMVDRGNLLLRRCRALDLAAYLAVSLVRSPPRLARGGVW